MPAGVRVAWVLVPVRDQATESATEIGSGRGRGTVAPLLPPHLLRATHGAGEEGEVISGPWHWQAEDSGTMIPALALALALAAAVTVVPVERLVPVIDATAPHPRVAAAVQAPAVAATAAL